MERKSETNNEAGEGPRELAELAGAHAAVIHRMLKDAPPFRPQAAAEELVAEFANGQNRMPAFLALYSRGAEVLPAVRRVCNTRIGTFVIGARSSRITSPTMRRFER
jgi:hypothetical protein